MSEYEYSPQKAAEYTEKMIDLTRQRWGDIPLSPQTFTWADGTVSVHVEHRLCDPSYLTLCITCKLSFHEDGNTMRSGHVIRETVEERDGELLWETYLMEETPL